MVQPKVRAAIAPTRRGDRQDQDRQSQLSSEFETGNNAPEPKALLLAAKELEETESAIPPAHIKPEHWQEWLASGVDPETIALNVRSLASSAPAEYLLYSPKLKRRNGGRLSDCYIKRYAHIEQGGWWAAGCDPLNNFAPMNWGCFKPDAPKLDEAKGKPIKYEHPPKEDTRAFFLDVSPAAWKKVAKRNKIKRYLSPLALRLKDQLHPIIFWQWVLLSLEVPIVITEGAKKAASLLSAGYAAIALPGITSGYRIPKNELGEVIGKPYLIPELQLLAQQGRTIYICFDRDSKQKTVRAVNGAIAKLGGLLAKAGCKVRVIIWDEPQKGIDDFIVANGEERLSEIVASAPTLDVWKTYLYGLLTFPVHVERNERYLGEINIPQSVQLIAIKSPKGTGKTQELARQAQLAHDQLRPVLVLSHRVQLGEANCNRFGVPYVTELKESEQGSSLGYGLCVDSLHPNSQARFSAERFSDCDLYIDEADQVFWHLLNASTCRSDRVVILKEFKKLVNNIIAGGGRIILSDADLSDLSIEFIQGLLDTYVEPFVVVNDWRPEEAWQVFNYTDKTPGGLLHSLEEHIEAGGKPFVCCSAQRAKSRFGSQAIERRLNKKFPELSILRIDSESIADPNHPAYGCINHLDKVLPEYDVIIASPSIETGVSIDLRGHFTSVWGIFQGVSPENSARQALARVREAVPRHIWAAPTGISKIANGATNVKALLASQKRAAQIHINLLKAADFAEDIDAGFQPVSLQTWAKLACRANAGMVAYRDSIMAALKKEGHIVIDIKLDKDLVKAHSDTMTAERNEQQREQAIAVASADVIDKAAAEDLENKRAKTKEQRNQQKKHFLTERYGVEVTPELVLRDDEGWHPKIRLHYYLTMGREFLAARDFAKAKAQVERGQGAVWLPDFNKSLMGAAVHVADKLNLVSLMDESREYRSNDPSLLEIAKQAIAFSKDVKAALNISISPRDSAIAIAQRLLAKFDLKLEFSHRETVPDPEGKRARVYRFVKPDDKRDEIFALWLEKDRAAAELAKSILVVPASKSAEAQPDASETEAEAIAVHPPDQALEALPIEESSSSTPLLDFAPSTPGNYIYFGDRGGGRMETQIDLIWASASDDAADELAVEPDADVTQPQPTNWDLLPQVLEALQNPSNEALNAPPADETEPFIVETYLPLRCEEEESQGLVAAVLDIAQHLGLNAIAKFAASASKAILDKVLDAAKLIPASAVAGAIAVAVPAIAAPPSPEVLALAEEIRQAKRWIEIEFAVMEQPDLKAAAWAALSDEDKARIKAMKPKPLLYVGDRAQVIDRASPHFGKSGKVKKLLGFQQDILLKFADGSEVSIAIECLERIK